MLYQLSKNVHYVWDYLVKDTLKKLVWNGGLAIKGNISPFGKPSIIQRSPTHFYSYAHFFPFTMITPPSPSAITISSCDRINCSCCNYDPQVYPSSLSSSPLKIVNVPVVTNFQVNVVIQHNRVIHWLIQTIIIIIIVYQENKIYIINNNNNYRLHTLKRNIQQRLNIILNQQSTINILHHLKHL